MKKKIFISILVIVFLGLSFKSHAQNALPAANLILSWEANNYFPANYPLKALATPTTPILVAAELIQDGKIIDTSKAEFRWYVNGELFSRGNGLKEILIQPSMPPIQISSYSIRTEVYLEKNQYENNLNINLFKPVVVIDYPSMIKTFKDKDKIALQIVPYFFDVNNFSDFDFFWKINFELQKQFNGKNAILLTVDKNWANTDNSFRLTAGVKDKKNFWSLPQETNLTFYISP